MPPIQSEVAIRSGTTAQWADTTVGADGEVAPVLGLGEVGIDTTTGDIKVGDGTTAFAALPRHVKARTGRTTLVAGTKVVTDAGITAASNIFLTVQSLGTVTAAKAVAVTARSNGVSFTITSSDNTDTSVVAYLITD